MSDVNEKKVLKRYHELGGLVRDGKMVNPDKASRARQFVKDQEREVENNTIPEESKEEQIRKRYIVLGGLVRGGQMVNNDKFIRAKEYVTAREKVVQNLIRRYDPRQTKGALAYSEMVDVEAWVAKDLDGHFIEAYAITDQYIDTIVKLAFPEVFGAAGQKENGVETVLRCAVGFGLVNKKIIELYRDFKSTRDDLVHKSIFNHKKARQLENLSKVKKLPLDVILEFEQLFSERSLHAYVFYLEKSQPIPADFIGMWGRIWAKRGKDLVKFFEDIQRLAKEKANPPSGS